MKTIIFTALLSIVLVGCAGTPYTLSKRAEQINASMTREAAHQVVKRNMIPNNRQLGLCAHSSMGKVNASGGFAQAPAILDGATIRYSAVGITNNVSHVSGDVLKGQGVLHTYSSLITMDEAFDLAELDGIWLGKTTHEPTCKGETDGTYVVLGKTSFKIGSKALVFHIDDQNLDEFIAAVAYLSPSTPLKSSGD